MDKKESSLKVLLFGSRDDKKLREYKATGNMDIIFLILVMYLVVMGTIMMFSAGYVKAESESGDPLSFLKKQILFLAIGIPVMLFASRVKPELYKRYSVLIYLFAIFTLILVLFYHTDVQSAEGDDYTRWIPIGPITIQPSDIAKIALVIFMATLMESNREKLETKASYVFLLMVPVVIVAGLVVLEKHFSAMFLLIAMGVIMIYLGGGKQWVFVVGIIFGIAVIVFVIVNMDFLPEYVQSRLKGWLDKDYDPLGKRWQTNQSLYAIGSGGLFGLGLGKSKQKHLYLPEPHNDFIFSVICEELGFIRTVIFVIIPFALLVLRGFQIAMRIKNRYVSLVVMGIMVQIGLQTFFNIGVVTGMLPNTGISLPFFSYGGTALLMQLGEMGIVLAASREMKNTKKIKE